MFLDSLTKYVRNFCMGKGLKKRIDDLVTQAVDGGLPNTAENRRMARHTAKQKIKPDQALMDRFAHTFLIGKKIDVTIGQIVTLARARPKKHQQGGSGS
jgi:hypothetical protein